MAVTRKEPVDMKLEVVVIGVSDVDRAKGFYEKLGWRLDADFVTGDESRVIQFTPYNSQASIIFGKGVTSAKPGSAGESVLAVHDINAARDELIARQNGSSSGQAAPAADRYMENVLHVLPR